MISNIVLAVIFGTVLGFTGWPWYICAIAFCAFLLLCFLSQFVPGLEALGPVPLYIVSLSNFHRMTGVGLVIFWLSLAAYAAWWLFFGWPEIHLAYKLFRNDAKDPGSQSKVSPEDHQSAAAVHKHQPGDVFFRIVSVISNEVSKGERADCSDCATALFDLLCELDLKLRTLFLDDMDTVFSFSEELIDDADIEDLAEFSSLCPKPVLPDPLSESEDEHHDAIFDILQPLFSKDSTALLSAIAEDVEFYFAGQLNAQAHECKQSMKQYDAFSDYILSHTPESKRKPLPPLKQKKTESGIVRDVLGM